jgi:long-chain acyl-CoA synthetase
MPSIAENARCHPDRAAVIFGNGDTVETYAQLEQRSRRIALALRAIGLRVGDCVALVLGNDETYMDFYWATQRTGLYLTPINWHLTAAEAAQIVANCDAKVVLVGSGLGAVGPALLSAGIGSSARPMAIGGEIAGFEAFDPFIRSVDENMPLTDETAGSVMIYSSGTTGQPKGIRRALPRCSPDDPAYTAAQTRMVRIYGFHADDRYLCTAPLYHAAPVRSCSAVHVLGGTVIVLKRFDAGLALRVIEAQRVTVSQWVPTHFKRLLDLPPDIRRRADTSSLRVALHAAAPCPVPLKRAMIDWWGPILLEYYAGTEGGGTIIDSEQWLQHPGSVGKPWSGVEVGVFDDQHRRILVPRTPGTIYFWDESPATRFVYHKNEALTSKTYRADWFTLGDMGYLDEDEYLFLTDRQSNMIISGGVNIYPQEIENCLAMHPKVFDVAVIGVPDEEMGEQVRAIVIPAAGIEPDGTLADELIAYTRSELAHFKCPRAVTFTRELPRTETGKLQKRLLTSRYGPDGPA